MLRTLACTVYILIHGTWASQGPWYLPGGDFFTALEQEARSKGHFVVPFCWSGQLRHEARVQAADLLIDLILSYPPTTRICLIAHSHGGNVALMAIKKLGTLHEYQRIAALYTLGAPVYKPPIVIDLNVLGYCYNLISFADTVQPVAGSFGREQVFHPRVANLCVTIDGVQPDHVHLHAPAIGKWFIYLDEQLHAVASDSFIDFIYEEPGIIDFTENQPPRYTVYPDWDRRLQKEQEINDRLWAAITRGIPSTSISCIDQHIL
jgi:pimeloyl-ACP methyl ester carboxylesterase